MGVVVEALNVMVFVVAVVVAAILAAAFPGPRRTRRKWGWGFRLGPLFFWRR